MGLRGVGGANENLTKSAHVSDIIGAGGVGREWKFTGTDYNSGLSTTGASSWFLVLGSTLNTSGNNVELLSASGSGNNGIRVTSGNYPELRVASTTHITGSQLSAGQSIYARFTTSSYVLSQRNKDTGSITWQTSSANYGTISPNWIMDAKSLSVALAIRFGYSPPRATIEYLHLNPWGIFKARSRRIWVDVLALGTTISPSQGGYTLTGQAPTINQPRTVLPGLGAYTYTGQTPSVIQARTIGPVRGGYTLSGKVPEVSQVAAIRPIQGEFVWTGQTPVIAQPQTITPAQGSYAFAGQSPNVSQEALSLSQVDLDAIAEAVWASPEAIAAHAKLDAILARITC